MKHNENTILFLQRLSGTMMRSAAKFGMDQSDADRLAEIASDMGADNYRHDDLFASPEQKKAVSETERITDQIGKQNWLNVHFSAFALSHAAWRNHIAANDAILGATRKGPNYE